MPCRIFFAGFRNSLNLCSVYHIVTKPAAGLPATEVASIMARIIHNLQKDAKTTQFPLVNGGEGTTEQLVTSTLGSFLEVEATGSDGEQVIIPIGFAGEQGTIGIIEMKLVAPELAARKESGRKKRQFAGTTCGIGELICDALDEGAFSVILGWDEPLARDAGFGMAQALGFAFLDGEGKSLDFRSTTPLAGIMQVDASSRPFNMLSAKFYAARSESVRGSRERGQMSVEDAMMEEELARIAEILRRDCGVAVPSGAIKSGGSYIEFGLAAFLGAEIKDGSLLALEVANLGKSLAAARGELVIVAPKLEDIASERASAAMKEVLKQAEETATPFHAIILDQPKPASEARYRNKFPLMSTVVSLNNTNALFDTQLRPADLRRQLAFGLEKAFAGFSS